MSLLETLLGHASLHDRASTAKKRAALKAKLTPAAETPKVFAKSLKLAEGDDRVLDVARVEVKGNLVLDDQSRLLVAGDLVVEGNILR
ncbi:hypothetical protein LY474_18200 [Myxococcus stipitatus]|uniref:hypothetical protein n=1 Tax=Myxococcus stipitatus TaxID=83455 RepID=UPI001F34CC19|nr:hypothetical protein [Myxococcus stipitatus]MCE9669732.1 hypothetical protein [Myxococcus stipitatus]